MDKGSDAVSRARRLYQWNVRTANVYWWEYDSRFRYIGTISLRHE